MKHTVKILMTEFVTHDVKRFIVERPAGYDFKPGQATELSINLPEYEKQKNPFTFTSLEESLVLEFTIKGYPEHNAVTKKLHQLVPGDELIVRGVWGTIHYKGPGVFIAGGAGVTPFIAILRRLHADGELAGNTLIFANNTRRDVILHEEFREMLGDRLILTFSHEQVPGYPHGRITREFLEKNVEDFSQHFYICGPPPMVDSLKSSLADLGASAEAVVFEE